MAKPYMQRFTGLELYDLQKTATMCAECLVVNKDETQHRTIPNPCTYAVTLEIVRRLHKYDSMLDTLEKISSGRFNEL